MNRRTIMTPDGAALDMDGPIWMKPDGSGLSLQVELTDKNNNSVTIAGADKIRRDEP